MTAVYHKPAKPSDHHSYGIMSDSPRRSSTSSFSSTDDDDMIAPCPSEKKEARRIHAEHLATTAAPSQQARPPQTERPKSWRNETSHFSPLSGDTDDTDPTALWRTMLAIQRAFGCYNSARMRAAIEMGDDQDVPVPSKTCLDLLNDSIAQLPEEARRQLDDFLSNESGSRRRSSSSWKHRLLHGPS